MAFFARASALACLLAIGLTGIAQATPPSSWKEASPFIYKARGSTLRDVLKDFAKTYGATVASTLPGNLPLDGKFEGNSAEDFLDRLALAHQFTWFFYNGKLYISPQQDRVSQRIDIGEMTASDVKQALLGLGLYEPKFGWGELQEESAVLVSGPRDYVQLVKQAIGREIETGDPETLMFRLKYAFLEDRQLTYRDKVVTVPGVLSILRNLARDTQSQNNNLNDGGGAGSSSRLRTSGNSSPKPGGDVPRNAPTTGGGRRESPAIIEGDVRTNTIIVRDQPKRHAMYRSMIERLDVPQSMVEIEAIIIDVERSRLKELGVDWASAFGSGSGRSTVEMNNLDAAKLASPGTLTINNLGRFLAKVRALEGEGEASIVAKPTVMTMDNLGAVIDLSRTVYIRLVGERVASAEPVTAGTFLKVTPNIVREGGEPQVRLFIDIEDGSVSEPAVNGTTVSGTPTVERSTVATQMVVQDQQSLIVGGFNVRTKASSTNGVTGLGRIPLIGGLFRNDNAEQRTRERMFIITPRVVNTAAAQARARRVKELPLVSTTPILPAEAVADAAPQGSRAYPGSEPGGE
ncbi:type III secretion system outer membrane ring subunit SctC [Ideonella sp. DXS29W]|uniref:Type III secretion system outer membrane ring subunit SctC n=1 Tax=Ideonella lacteola TaxID=2984193 RepID=A0ABU9BJN0_9BURK